MLFVILLKLNNICVNKTKLLKFRILSLFNNCNKKKAKSFVEDNVQLTTPLDIFRNLYYLDECRARYKQEFPLIHPFSNPFKLLGNHAESIYKNISTTQRNIYLTSVLDNDLNGLIARSNKRKKSTFKQSRQGRKFKTIQPH